MESIRYTEPSMYIHEYKERLKNTKRPYWNLCLLWIQMSLFGCLGTVLYMLGPDILRVAFYHLNNHFVSSIYLLIDWPICCDNLFDQQLGGQPLKYTNARQWQHISKKNDYTLLEDMNNRVHAMVFCSFPITGATPNELSLGVSAFNLLPFTLVGFPKRWFNYPFEWRRVRHWQ